MNNWSGAIRSEWDLIWLKARTKVLLLVSIVIPIGLSLLMNAVQSSFGLLLITSSSLMLMTLNMMTVIYLPLLIFMLVSEGFTFQPNILKAFFLRPIHRYKLYAAKLIAMLGIICVHLGAALTTALLTEWIALGGSSWGRMIEAISSYSISILPMFVWIVFGSFVAQWFRNPTLSMICLILFYLFAQLVPFIFPSAAMLSLASYNDWFAMISIGTHSILQIWNGLLYLISSMSLYFLLGIFIFERRNI